MGKEGASWVVRFTRDRRRDQEDGVLVQRMPGVEGGGGGGGWVGNMLKVSSVTSGEGWPVVV